MLYEPADFEPLTDERWDPGHVEDAIAAIVADTDSAFDPAALWPAHEWEGWEEPLPLKTLYVGAAGVIWALDALRRRGHAEWIARAKTIAVWSGNASEGIGLGPLASDLLIMVSSARRSF